MKKNSIKIALNFLLIVSILSVVGCVNSENKQEQKINLTNIAEFETNTTNNTINLPIEFDFSYGSCEDEISPYDESQLGVKQAIWDKDELKVTAFITINCADSIGDGSYIIDGNKITLGYDLTKCDTCTTCLCAHKLIFILNNINKTVYDFELKSYLNSSIIKNMDKAEALQKLGSNGCFYSLSDEKECIKFEDPYWTIAKEGCFGKCKLNSDTGDIEIDANPMCTGLLIPCETTDDCSSIVPNCALRYVCYKSSCVPQYDFD